MTASDTYVHASYKTGQYIGVAEDERNQMKLVKVLAVIKHPWQGDLHNPKNAEVSFFQERKALSYGERAWMPVHTVKEYGGPIPDYKESLVKALSEYISHLKNDGSDWAKRSIECLDRLKKEYKID
jgi:kinase-associated protein B